MAENDQSSSQVGHQESYRDPCPFCGARLIGFSKGDYIEHLRENGETFAARLEEKLVVDP
jgi:hypothetical protein